MKNTFYLFGLLLIVLFHAACSSQKQASMVDSGARVVAEQKELIRENISDPERQSHLLRIVTEIEKESAEFFSIYKTYHQDIVELNKHYHSTRQDVEQLNNAFNRHYEQYLRLLLKKRNAMKQLVNREEWSMIMARKSSFIPE